MNKERVKDAVRNFLLAMKDNEAEVSEEMADEALEMTEEIKDALEEVEMTDETPDVLEVTKDEDIDVKVADAVARALRKAGIGYRAKDESMEILDELEETISDEEMTLEQDEMNEEAVTVSASEANDSVSVKMLLRQMKPAIASVSDSSQRRRLANALVKAVNKSNKTSDAYSSIRKAAAQKAVDGFVTKDSSFDAASFGDEIAKRFNPHYKEG